MLISHFNKNLKEELLSPFAQAYTDKVSVYWQQVTDASLYKIQLYIMDTDKHCRVNQHQQIDYENRNNSFIHSAISGILFQKGSKYQDGNGYLYTVTKIGIKNLYLIQEVIVDRNQFHYVFQSVLPSKYIVVLSAENKNGEVISLSRGIDIDLYPLIVDTSKSAIVLHHQVLTKAYPKDWYATDYYPETEKGEKK